MTLKECYEKLDGNYDEVIGRLRKEELLQKFVLKFLNDPSFNNLCIAMETHDRENAFMAAHTIKGVSQNLSFTKLYNSSCLLTEALRDAWEENSVALFNQTSKDYEQTVNAIKEYKETI